MNNNTDIQEIARLERNAYKRRWRAKNPDKVKASNERYWERKAEKKVREEETE